MNEPRAFDARAIAQHIANGETVLLGEHLVLKLDGGDYSARCSRCEAEQRVPFRPAALAMLMDRCMAFVLKHQHKGPVS